MSNEPEQPDDKSFRFSMRTLLLTMTVLCVFGAVLAIFLEPRYQIGVWIMVVTYSLGGLYIYRYYQNNQRRIKKVAADGVTVKIDPKWIGRIRSPWFFVIAAFTGVSVTFAPLCLIWCGSFRQYGLLEWILVPLCLLMIYCVPTFYMRLAGEVIHQLAKQELSQESIDESDENSNEIVKSGP